MLSYYILATLFYIITKYEYYIITAGIKIVQIHDSTTIDFNTDRTYKCY